MCYLVTVYKDQFSLLTSCVLLACILLAYLLFSTYKADILYIPIPTQYLHLTIPY